MRRKAKPRFRSKDDRAALEDAYRRAAQEIPPRQTVDVVEEQGSTGPTYAGACAPLNG